MGWWVSESWSRPMTGAGEHSGNLAAPRHGKENHHQQRQIENGEEVQPQRNEGLQKERDQRNQDGRRGAEAVNLNLLPRCVSNGHASEEYPATPEAWFAGCCGLGEAPGSWREGCSAAAFAESRAVLPGADGWPSARSRKPECFVSAPRYSLPWLHLSRRLCALRRGWQLRSQV